MIYQIEDTYYIKVSPIQYVQLDFEIKEDELILVPTKNKIEVNSTDTKIKEINFQNEKDIIKNKIMSVDNEPRHNKEKKTSYRNKRK